MSDIRNFLPSFLGLGSHEVTRNESKSYALSSMCTEISGHWKAFATETEKAISERRDKLYSGQYDGVTETTVAAYSLHEIESLKKSTLISNLDFYPRLTDSIISFIRKNGQTTTDTRSRVTFFSTMLPRHYFMFPHARAGRVKGLAFTRVSYPEPFVDDYKKRLHDMIDSSADKVLFSRYTVCETHGPCPRRTASRPLSHCLF